MVNVRDEEVKAPRSDMKICMNNFNVEIEWEKQITECLYDRMTQGMNKNELFCNHAIVMGVIKQRIQAHKAALCVCIHRALLNSFTTKIKQRPYF